MLYIKLAPRVGVYGTALASLAAALTNPVLALAGASGVAPGTAPINCSQLKTLIENISQLGGGLFLALGVIVFLIAAYYFLFGAGSEDAATKGRQYLTYGVLGIVIALIAYGLPAILATGFGETFKLPACT